MIGTQETILIFVIAVLLFGPGKIPELARTLGRASAEFKRAQRDFMQEFEASEIETEREERIHDVASKMGIDLENKTTDELLEAMKEHYREENKSEGAGQASIAARDSSGAKERRGQ